MFDHKKAQNKWSKYWIDNKIFKTDTWDFSKPKYYVLDMFPYPSGVGLHTGHAEAFTAPDVVGRMKKMQGYNVLHAMGFDSFGLPAEQYAISTGNHPSIITEANIKTFSSQLKEMGFGLDWDRVISTCDPSYYKWTQWIFIQLFKDGVAKQVNMPVNWCEELGCVLSNDEVIDGKSERGGFPVIRKNMKQWVIDIPQYAERLLSGLNEIDFPESTKEIERNWIGKSIGAEVIFKIDNSSYDFTVFTTRCDTLFGATYCVLSPEHVLVDKITTEEKSEEVNKYKEICARKSDLERTELNKEKSGVFTGAYAINPVNNKKIPIWISDYVLSSYGTGAIMAVPAHDERDYEFAKKFNIEIIEVLKGGDISNQAFTEDGIHINSEFLNGLGKEESISKMISWLEEHKCGKQKINYKMREWIFARQRYWGEPIPIVELENGDLIAIDEKDLPLILPELKEYAPDKNGNSPLDKAKEWINVTIDGKKGKRETSTMPGSAGSSWYYFRYIDPFNDKCIADKELLKHWMPVDLYVGGPEHAVGHLLFSRMWCNYLYDKGISPVKEPYKKLFHQGMILGSNGIKMGKRYPEYSVNPSDMVEKYGSDALRLYLMFMGPLEADKPWNNNGIEGARRFIDRVWRLFEDNKIVDKDILNLEKVYNETIKKVTKDYESLSINTAISQMMIFINSVYKEGEFPKKYAEGFIKIFSPLCPFISEEMWSYLGYSNSVALESWPIYDESKIVDDKIIIAVSINGKLRTTLLVDSDIKEEELKKMVFNDDVIEKNIQGKEIIKTIVVPKKIVNIVVKG